MADEYDYSWFMYISYIFKKFPISEVLVSSDIRPFMNVMFYNVLTPQGSSFCNSARLSFQSFALRDKCWKDELSRQVLLTEQFLR